MRSVLGGEVSVGLVRVDTHLFTSYLISNALEVYDVIVLNLVDDGATDLSVDGVGRWSSFEESSVFEHCDQVHVAMIVPCHDNCNTPKEANANRNQPWLWELTPQDNIFDNLHGTLL